VEFNCEPGLVGFIGFMGKEYWNGFEKLFQYPVFPLNPTNPGSDHLQGKGWRVN
jgi:hypothetical protein